LLITRKARQFNFNWHTLHPRKWFPVNAIRFLFRQWRLLLSALIAGAIIHILLVLSAAQFEQSSAFRQLSEGLPINRVTFAKAVTAKAQPLPFYNPDALYSYCPFDASTSRIRLSAKLPDAGWSLSLHTPIGENFYFVPGSETRPTDVQLVLVPPGTVFAHGAIEVENGSQGVPQVKLTHVRGLAILRTPIKGFEYRRLADELRSTFSCGVENSAATNR
jgi:uncharacterized membrane protein